MYFPSLSEEWSNSYWLSMVLRRGSAEWDQLPVVYGRCSIVSTCGKNVHRFFFHFWLLRLESQPECLLNLLPVIRFRAVRWSFQFFSSLSYDLVTWNIENINKFIIGSLPVQVSWPRSYRSYCHYYLMTHPSIWRYTPSSGSLWSLGYSLWGSIGL